MCVCMRSRFLNVQGDESGLCTHHIDEYKLISQSRKLSSDLKEYIHLTWSVVCVYVFFLLLVCCYCFSFFLCFFNATIDFDWSTIWEKERKKEIKEMRRRRSKTELLSFTALIHSLLFSCLLLFLFKSMQTIFTCPQFERWGTKTIRSFSFIHTHTRTRFLEIQHNQWNKDLNRNVVASNIVKCICDSVNTAAAADVTVFSSSTRSVYTLCDIEKSV